MYLKCLEFIDLHDFSYIQVFQDSGNHDSIKKKKKIK